MVWAVTEIPTAVASELTRLWMENARLLKMLELSRSATIAQGLPSAFAVRSLSSGTRFAKSLSSRRLCQPVGRPADTLPIDMESVFPAHLGSAYAQQYALCHESMIN